MQDNSYLEDCSDDDVVSFPSSNTQPLIYKLGNFREAVKKVFHDKKDLVNTVSNLLEYEGFLISKVRNWMNQNFAKDSIMWFDDGVNCEILKVGSQGWKTGKIRIRVSLEFCPDQPEVEDTIANDESEISLPESPLDDLRRMMNHQNQQ